MQISGSYQLDQTRLIALESNPATGNQTGKQQRIHRANDSYNKSAGAALVIDAEYVDQYSQEKVVQSQQKNTITFEPKTTLPAPAEQQSEQPSSSSYQLQAPKTPPPGTYINYFA